MLALYIFTRNGYDRFFRTPLRILFFISGIISTAILVIEFGFHYPEPWKHTLQLIASGLIFYLIAHEFLSLIFTHKSHLDYVKTHRFQLFLIGIILIQWLFKKNILHHFLIEGISPQESALLYLAISQILLLLTNLISLIAHTHFSRVTKITPSIIFISSFALVIVIGWLLLMLPRSQKVPVSALDTLFTVVSAVSVTGLSTLSISDSFTRVGQVIVLAIIQIGGLGLMTLTSFFAYFLTGRVSVSNQIIMQDLLSEESIGNVRHLVKSIAMITFSIELAGALYLYFTDPLDYPSDASRFFHALFHSVSAFCNAGFSIFPSGMEQMPSHSYLSGVMTLIVLGGVGFPVLNEIRHKLSFSTKRYQRFTISVKLNLLIHISLIVVGFLFYFLFESRHTLQSLPLEDSLFHSLFYSITMRTAGFNTLPIGGISPGMLSLSLFFMWIGAAPASTGGGIKTSTFGVVLLHILNFARGRNRLEIFSRTIATESITRAFATIFLSIALIFVGITILLVTESFRFEDIIFEVISAFGTVGLSRGITPDLSSIGKLVICFVMLTGRIGMLTFVVALIPKKDYANYRYPTEYVIVG